VHPLATLEDCFRERMLRRVAPSAEKANESLSLAQSYLDEARQIAGIGARRMRLPRVPGLKPVSGETAIKRLLKNCRIVVQQYFDTTPTTPSTPNAIPMITPLPMAI